MTSLFKDNIKHYENALKISESLGLLNKVIHSCFYNKVYS